MCQRPFPGVSIRLLITSCLVALFSLSALATEKIISIEASYKAKGSNEFVTVWIAKDVILKKEDGNCFVSYGLLPQFCHIEDLDRDSLTGHRQLVSMNLSNFQELQRWVKLSPELSREDIKSFHRNIYEYVNNPKLFRDRKPLKFYLYEDLLQETNMISSNSQSISRIRVIQH